MKRVKRWLVIVVALFVGGTVLVARPAGEEDAAEGADNVVMEVEQGRFREAPMLVGLVQSGNLPAVDERLPTDPLVWPPPEMEAYEEGIGEYGGVLRLAHERYPLMLNEYLQMGLTKLEFDGFVPLLAKDWEFSSDYRTVTFYLREGIKWSDGEPFTANDIMFGGMIWSNRSTSRSPWEHQVD
jgi:ABC-type transport system substrate-binding protein